MRHASALVSVLFSAAVFAFDATQLPKHASGGDPTGLKTLKSGIARVKLTVKLPKTNQSTAWVGIEATWQSPTRAKNVAGSSVTFDNRWRYLFYVNSANANLRIYSYARKRSQRIWRWTVNYCKLYIYAYPFVSNKPADVLTDTSAGLFDTNGYAQM